jgi:hypothetical protein
MNRDAGVFFARLHAHVRALNHYHYHGCAVSAGLCVTPAAAFVAAAAAACMSPGQDVPGGCAAGCRPSAQEALCGGSCGGGGTAGAALSGRHSHTAGWGGGGPTGGKGRDIPRGVLVGALWVCLGDGVGVGFGVHHFGAQ